VNEQTIDIPTAAGKMETFITHPEQKKRYPAVILYMDVWGVREVLYDLARRIGTVGYYVLVPDVYYRQGRIRTNFRDEHGRAISLAKLDKATQEKVLEPQKHLTDAMVIEDAGSILEFIDRQHAVKPGPVGTIGYCMGGRHVLQVGAQYPEHIKAMASLHGTTIISDQKDSPHRTVGKLQGEVYCGFAETDAYAPLSMVEEWNALIKPCKVAYQFKIHIGAHHGYALPDRDLHDKQASDRDWEVIFDVFRRRLAPYQE
jgi:carboxymethylenebutenolidase